MKYSRGSVPLLFVLLTFDTLTINLSRILYFHKEDTSMEEIQRMQDNLLLIRRTVGWTAEEFGDQIGVTRQTINNIESGRNKLTKTQYIAMRSVIEAEMVKHPDETQMLRALLDMLRVLKLFNLW